MMVLIAISIVFYLEAWLEEVVIDMKNPASADYILLNRQEHFRSAVFAAAIILCAVAVLVVYEQNYWLIAPVVISRRIWFDFVLIVKRDRPRHLYEGSDWWNDFFKKIFGKHGRKKELYAEVAITVVFVLINFIV